MLTFITLILSFKYRVQSRNNNTFFFYFDKTTRKCPKNGKHRKIQNDSYAYD